MTTIDTSEASDEGSYDHLVHFYENDDVLCDVVTDFLADGAAAGEPLLVIATEAHRTELGDRLRARGIDVARALASSRLVLLDARETLAGLMIDSMPDEELFAGTVGRILDAASSARPADAAPGPPRVRAYGEMVDLLWREGNLPAAVRLEEMWNDLQRTRRFSLLCAYAVASFYKEAADLPRLCASHTGVVRREAWSAARARPPSPAASPHERAAALPAWGGVPDVAPSARHVQALAGEIAQRKQIERELRESLRELRRRDEEREADARRTARLVRITTAIADAVTADQVFEAVVDRLGAALGASSAGLWLVQPGGRTARLARAQGYADTTARAFEEMPLEGTAPSLPVLDAIRGGQPVWIASQDELLRQYPHLAGAVTPGRSYRVSCLPLFARERTIGALGLTFEAETGTSASASGAGPVDEDERSFLMLVARYSAQALERLTLLQSERDSRAVAEAAAARLELLYRLARAVIAAERVEQVFEAALDTIALALGTERASVLVFDAGGVMRFKAWRGLSDDYRRAVEGHSPWGRETRDPTPIIVDDVEADPTMAGYLPLFRGEGIGALGFIPLVADGQLLGKFMVYYPGPRRLAAQELGLARAIADHVAAAISRFAAVGELQQTVRFNEMFTGILGHDLRNPLGAIITAARLVMLRDDGGKLVKPLSRILTSGERMTRMIDQLLDFTRVRLGGGIPVVPRPADLLPILRQVIDELDDANPGWTLRLEHAGQTEGRWDGDRLSQVFSNLVGNAVQHGVAAHGVDVRLDATAADTVEVTIHSMGTIPQAVLPRLFEPLEAGVRRLETSRGLGLGLYITREIVRAHGGRIDVRSDAADGTTFTIVLPRHRQPEGAR